MKDTTQRMFIFDPEALAALREKLEDIDSKLEKLMKTEGPGYDVEWLTVKKFMDAVEIKGRATLYKFLDRLNHKKLNGKIFIHRDEVKRYYEGEYND